MANQPENTLGRHLEAFAPVLENAVIIGQQSLKERLYSGVAWVGPSLCFPQR